MKPIVVKNQVRIGLGKSLSLTLAGMYYRFTRSTITMSIVALAVAFLGYMFTYGVIVQERTNAACAELDKSRLLAQWSARLAGVDPIPAVIDNIRLNRTDRISEYRIWNPVPDSTFSHIRIDASKFSSFISYLANMREQARAVLLGENDPYTLPMQLMDRNNIERFHAQVKELHVPVPFGSADSFGVFLTQSYPSIIAYVKGVQAGQHSAIDAINQAMNGHTLLDMLIDSPENIKSSIRENGYVISEGHVAILHDQATLAKDQNFLVNSLLSPDIRSQIARHTGVDQKRMDIGIVTRWISSKKNAVAYTGIVKVSMKGVPDIPRLTAVAENYQRLAKLQRIIGSEQPSDRKGFSAMPQSTRWLILVSFLVCAVGVCNTMFMSVTERFTEIATMKCLGAMDSFIMVQFVLESIIQGVAGSIIGIVIGILLAFLRGVTSYGVMIFEAIPVNDIGSVVVFSVVVGVVLAAVAAVGPAYMAARLAPMEAMRVE